jgi:hypothetical protein
MKLTINQINKRISHIANQPSDKRLALNQRINDRGFWAYASFVQPSKPQVK